MSKWVEVKNCPVLSKTDLEEQVRLREELKNQLIGTLYPGILADEIQDIRDLINYGHFVEAP